MSLKWIGFWKEISINLTVLANSNQLKWIFILFFLWIYGHIISNSVPTIQFKLIYTRKLALCLKCHILWVLRTQFKFIFLLGFHYILLSIRWWNLNCILFIRVCICYLKSINQIVCYYIRIWATSLSMLFNFIIPSFV